MVEATSTRPRRRHAAGVAAAYHDRAMSRQQDNALRAVCVYCGSSPGRDPAYAAAAADLARGLAARDIGLVYGGAGVGLMGALADAMLAAGGRVVGVIPETLMRREVAHPGLTDLRVVASMHERKATMAELADAFVALPGGLGTLEELFEMLTWAQLGLHAKPCGAVDTAGYYAPLARFLDGAVAAGFVRPAHRELLLIEPEPETLLRRFEAFVPRSARRRVDP